MSFDVAVRIAFDFFPLGRGTKDQVLFSGKALTSDCNALRHLEKFLASEYDCNSVSTTMQEIKEQCEEEEEEK